MVKSSRLDGMCVYTIVFTRPMRCASQAAARCENADSTRPAAKSTATCAADAPKRSAKK